MSAISDALGRKAPWRRCHLKTDWNEVRQQVLRFSEKGGLLTEDTQQDPETGECGISTTCVHTSSRQ